MSAADRRAIRAADRAERSGSGPVVSDRPAASHPGAHGAFALFGEVLMVGLLVTLVSLPVVTLPAALAAGVHHMRRYAAAEDSRTALFWKDVKRALPGGTVVGLVAVVAVVLLVLDIDLGRSGALPGGPAFVVIGWAGLAAIGALLLTAAGLWQPEEGWKRAISQAPAALAADPIGALYAVAAAGLVCVVTWMLPPLVIAGLGCAVLAIVAIPERRRNR